MCEVVVGLVGFSCIYYEVCWLENVFVRLCMLSWFDMIWLMSVLIFMNRVMRRNF